MSLSNSSQVVRTHHATPTESAPPEPTQTSSAPPLPSRTIIALGLGFIGAALAVIAISFLIRANENVGFRQVWDSSGGWWGTFSSQDDTLWRRIRVKKDKPPPFFWEVVLCRDLLDPQAEFKDTDQPLAAVASRATVHDPDDIVISALIVMPSHPADDEIPDLMIGTTHLRPSIPLAEAGFNDLRCDDDDAVEYEIRQVPRPHWSTAWGLDARIP